MRHSLSSKQHSSKAPKGFLQIDVQARFCCLSIYILVSMPTLAEEASLTTASWDKCLPQVEISNVSYNDMTLVDVCRDLCATYGIRNILWVEGDAPYQEALFSFHEKSCAASKVLDALSQCYSMKWLQDQETGLIWTLPANRNYDALLAGEIVVPRDQTGLQMCEGILDIVQAKGNKSTSTFSVYDNDVLQIRYRAGLNNAVVSALNYTVDIPAGKLSVRSLLCHCAIAHPAKTFFIVTEPFPASPEYTYVTVAPKTFTTKTPGLGRAPEGIYAFWNSFAGTLGEAPVSDGMLRRALAHEDPGIRWAGKKYFEATGAAKESFVAEAASEKEALWASLATAQTMLRVCDPTLGVTDAAATALQRASRSEILLKGDARLAVLVALEQTRLSADPGALLMLSQRDFCESDLSEIQSDIARIIRLSKTVHTALNDSRFGNLRSALDVLESVTSVLEGPWSESRGIQFCVDEPSK